MIKSYVLGFYFKTPAAGSVSEVALIRKSKPDFQRGKWNGIGGAIKLNEAGHVAMRREFLEETGCDVWAWRLFGKFFLPAQYEVFCWVAKGAAALVSTTKERVEWWDIRGLSQNKMPNLTWLIPLALDESVNFSSIEQEKLQ